MILRISAKKNLKNEPCIFADLETEYYLVNLQINLNKFRIPEYFASYFHPYEFVMSSILKG